VIPKHLAFILASYFAAAIRLEAILGAFAAGLVSDETDKKLQKQVIIADLLVPLCDC